MRTRCVWVGRPWLEGTERVRGTSSRLLVCGWGVGPGPDGLRVLVPLLPGKSTLTRLLLSDVRRGRSRILLSIFGYQGGASTVGRGVRTTRRVR